MSNHPAMRFINDRAGGEPTSAGEAATLIRGKLAAGAREDLNLPRWALAKARQGDYHTIMAYERELIERGEIAPQETAMALIDGNTGKPVADQFNPEGSGVYQRYEAPLVVSPMQERSDGTDDEGTAAEVRDEPSQLEGA